MSNPDYPADEQTAADVTKKALNHAFGGEKPKRPVPSGYEGLLGIRGDGVVGACVGLPVHDAYVPEARRKPVGRSVQGS